MNNPTPVSTSSKNEHGEVDAIQIILLIWKRKLWIFSATVLAAIAGVIYAMLSPPVYVSEATISLRETGKTSDASRIFSQLGGMGGMVASQLGIGNTSLNKIEIILKSYDLTETVVTKNNLMPVLFPDSAKAPTLRGAVEMLRRSLISVVLDPKVSVIRISVKYKDPEMAKRLADYYLIALNDRIRSNVIRDAEVNREFLEKQLTNTFDPILREKLQNMIGMEIEQSMMVSSQAFEIMEKPMLPLQKAKPKKKIIVVLSILAGFFLSILWIFADNLLAKFKSALAGVEVR